MGFERGNILEIKRPTKGMDSVSERGSSGQSTCSIAELVILKGLIGCKIKFTGALMCIGRGRLEVIR